MGIIVTAKELSEYLKLSDSTIYNLASKGEIPGFRIGDSWRFDMDEVVEMIEKSKKVHTSKDIQCPSDVHGTERPKSCSTSIGFSPARKSLS